MSVEREVSLRAVTGAEQGGGGVEAGEALLRFTEAAADRDEAEMTAARDALVGEAGNEVMVDAAGVLSAFQMMNRIANSTGTPLDETLASQTTAVEEQLELGSYRSRRVAGDAG